MAKVTGRCLCCTLLRQRCNTELVDRRRYQLIADCSLVHTCIEPIAGVVCSALTRGSVQAVAELGDFHYVHGRVCS